MEIYLIILSVEEFLNSICNCQSYVVFNANYYMRSTAIVTKYLVASLSASTAHAQCGLIKFLDGTLWKFVFWFYLCKNFYNRLQIAKVMGVLMHVCFFYSQCVYIE